jgi:hypothetical protein
MMKRIIVAAIILLSASVLHAQKDNDFYKHELKASVGPTLFPDLWFKDECYGNFSVAYFYSPDKSFGVGVNFIGYFGEKLYYHLREYNADGSFNDFSKSKIKQCLVIAPEIRFPYLNKETVMLYGALSGGIGWEYGYNGKHVEYPKRFRYLHVTCFGFNCYFGKNKNIILGGELGIGFKGLLNIHGGYRF